MRILKNQVKRDFQYQGLNKVGKLTIQDRELNKLDKFKIFQRLEVEIKTEEIKGEPEDLLTEDELLRAKDLLAEDKLLKSKDIFL